MHSNIIHSALLNQAMAYPSLQKPHTTQLPSNGIPQFTKATYHPITKQWHTPVYKSHIPTITKQWHTPVYKSHIPPNYQAMAYPSLQKPHTPTLIVDTWIFISV